ncbi:hypothetical protein [Cellulomonas humilata]|uniref:Adenylate cyclase n=1 Tax=Cellulomonas humilata TaxID=144055 RepID=A0ABU0EE92_9CELL|nr:hypothetical protein [Cellulomonas humilata]MDQ0373591.1 hypothetical protein [Cellulomonas humilata]
MATTGGVLLSDELLRLRELVSEADGIELKVTVPEVAHRSTTATLGLDPIDAQIRHVYFFDTPDLALNKVGVVVRARRIQGGGNDSVVKLRPVVPSELPRDIRKSPNFSVEVDIVPGSFVCSASLKNKLPATAVRASASGERPLRKLFSKEQRAFFAEHAPDGLTIDDLSILGPIFVLKLKVVPETFDRRLVAEMWFYPDGSRILELSTKCLPTEGIAVAGDLRRLLGDKGVDITGAQQTKTSTALEFFSAELQAKPA